MSLSYFNESIDWYTTESETHGKCDTGPTVTFPATEHHRPLTITRLYCLVTEAHVYEHWRVGTRKSSSRESNPHAVNSSIMKSLVVPCQHQKSAFVVDHKMYLLLSFSSAARVLSLTGQYVSVVFVLCRSFIAEMSFFVNKLRRSKISIWLFTIVMHTVEWTKSFTFKTHTCTHASLTAILPVQCYNMICRLLVIK